MPRLKLQTVLNFIARLQNADEATRKRWLIGLSGASMAIVIALWALYINVIVPPTAPLIAQDDIQTEPGVFKTFATGFRVVIGELKKSSGSLSNYLGEAFEAKNEITLQGSERNFILDELKPIPTTPLP